MRTCLVSVLRFLLSGRERMWPQDLVPFTVLYETVALMSPSLFRLPTDTGNTILLYVEAAIIMPTFTLRYHSYLAFVSALFALAVCCGTGGWLLTRYGSDQDENAETEDESTPSPTSLSLAG